MTSASTKPERNNAYSFIDTVTYLVCIPVIIIIGGLTLAIISGFRVYLLCKRKVRHRNNSKQTKRHDT